MAEFTDEYALLARRIADRGLDLEAIERALLAFNVETPSWGYGDSGTRFGVFAQPGRPRDVYERIEDAAEVNRLTGSASSVALHFPWDQADDYGDLRRHIEAAGLTVGAVNPNLFQDPDYKFGSVTNPDPAIRAKAVEHLLECSADRHRTRARPRSRCGWPTAPTTRARTTCARRRRRLLDSLAEVYAQLPAEQELLVEYKFFEPAFYATDIADWGSALLICQQLGERANVLIDLGHHAQGVNIEQIVALLTAGRPSRRLPLQQPQVRRRRPDRRLGQPARAVPDLHRAGSAERATRCRA